MHIMLTVSSLICAFATLLGCWVAVRSAQGAAESHRKCMDRAAKLDAERARVTVLERESEALRKWIQRVDGKLSSLARETPPYEPAEAPVNLLRDVFPEPPATGAPPCENYALAQREGPSSDAAKCECEYCEGKRAERAQLRAAARRLPPHAATVRAIKDNS